MRIRRNLRLLLVVACVIAGVVMSDAASARSWLTGGHATPEQFARHLLYESIGIHDHHGHAPNTAAADARVTFAAAPAFTVAVPGGAADPGQVARDFRDGVMVASPALVILARLAHGKAPQPTSPDVLLFDPPPRSAA